MVVNATWQDISGHPVQGEAIGLVMLDTTMFVLWEDKSESRFTAVHMTLDRKSYALEADYWDGDERNVTLAAVMGALIARVEDVMP